MNVHAPASTGCCSGKEIMRQRAFTLIEMLVVIAIIAVLAAILFPVFAQAKTAAKQTRGLSQLKQLGICSQICFTDFEYGYRSFHRGLHFKMSSESPIINILSEISSISAQRYWREEPSGYQHMARLYPRESIWRTEANYVRQSHQTPNGGVRAQWQHWQHFDQAPHGWKETWTTSKPFWLTKDSGYLSRSLPASLTNIWPSWPSSWVSAKLPASASSSEEPSTNTSTDGSGTIPNSFPNGLSFALMPLLVGLSLRLNLDDDDSDSDSDGRGTDEFLSISPTEEFVAEASPLVRCDIELAAEAGHDGLTRDGAPLLGEQLMQIEDGQLVPRLNKDSTFEIETRIGPLDGRVGSRFVRLIYKVLCLREPGCLRMNRIWRTAIDDLE